jgi:plastocyanin
MRTALVLAGLAAVMAVVPASSAAPKNTVGATTRDQAGMQLLLSRSRVDAGPGEIEFFNAGEDDHDLVMQREGSDKEIQFDRLSNLESQTLDVRFKRRARYQLWCSLEKHRIQGMEATLKVKRR